MINVITKSVKTHEIDQLLIRQHQYSPYELVNLAGESLYRHKPATFKSYLFLIGPGLNGADGLACIKQILVNEPNASIQILIAMDRDSYEGHRHSVHQQLWAEFEKVRKIKVYYLDETFNIDQLGVVDCIYDCIYGVGFKDNLPQPVSSLFESIRTNLEAFIIACDLPSGGCVDQSYFDKQTLRANLTISMLTYKAVFALDNNVKYTGRVLISKMGLNPTTWQDIARQLFMNDTTFYLERWRPMLRNPEIIKQDLQTVLLFAGSKTYPTTHSLVANMCLRAGSGLVFIAQSGYHHVYSNLYSEAILSRKIFALHLLKKRANKLVVGIGNGMGRTNYTRQWVRRVARSEAKMVVVDGDGLNYLTEKVLRQLKGRLIITPHLYEFARLLNRTPEAVNAHRLELARKFAAKHEAIVVLKGPQTIITDGKYLVINNTGNQYMATPGMGDVLTGLITSYLSQQIPSFEACYGAVHMHGLIGDEIAAHNSIVMGHDIIAGYHFK